MTEISEAKERRFKYYLHRRISEGHIPTPTDCLRWLGKDVSKFTPAGGPTMAAPYTKARIEVFTERGLIKEKGRWRFPSKNAK